MLFLSLDSNCQKEQKESWKETEKEREKRRRERENEEEAKGEERSGEPVKSAPLFECVYGTSL